MIWRVLDVPCTSYSALAPLNLGESLGKNDSTASQAVDAPAKEKVCSSVKGKSGWVTG